MDFSNRLSIGVGSLEKAGNVIVVDFHEEGVYFCIFSPGQREWFLARKDDDGIDRQVATYETILKGIPNMMQEDVQNYLLHGIAFDWDVLTAFHHFGFLLFLMESLRECPDAEDMEFMRACSDKAFCTDTKTIMLRMFSLAGIPADKLPSLEYDQHLGSWKELK